MRGRVSIVSIALKVLTVKVSKGPGVGRATTVFQVSIVIKVLKCSTGAG